VWVHIQLGDAGGFQVGVSRHGLRTMAHFGAKVGPMADATTCILDPAVRDRYSVSRRWLDTVKLKDASAGSGEGPAKECPRCQAVIHAAYSKCPVSIGDK
jgi:hypothetical protein